MSIVTLDEALDFDPDARDWNRDDANIYSLGQDPEFKWTDEDLEELQREDDLELENLRALAGWWEMEGVRCATFGPPRNPYLALLKEREDARR